MGSRDALDVREGRVEKELVMQRQAEGEEKKLVKKSLVSHNPSPAKHTQHGSCSGHCARTAGLSKK